MTKLFEPLHLREIVLKNRVMISPMCTYSCGPDGKATDWHLAHYGRMAIGGAGLVMLEATAVTATGRHCYGDIGIWSDEHVPNLQRIASVIKGQNSVAGIQLQHAGRKASANRPWHGAGPLGEEDIRLRNEFPWPVVGPSPVPYTEGAPIPAELTANEIAALTQSWVDAARRADVAGFDMIEIHCAHGYLLNQFLSPLVNQRNDRYGGTLEGRMRWPLEVVSATRAIWPANKPMSVRVSCVDGGGPNGWTLDDTVIFARELKALGVDVIDCSSGGISGGVANNPLTRKLGYQVPFASRIRTQVNIPTIAVGLILTPRQAADIVDEGKADVVAIGREALANPNWPSAARIELQPHRGYQDWSSPFGWWLDKRSQLLKTLEN